MKKTKKLSPVNVGDKLKVEVITKGDKGDGIAKVEGFTIIVPKGSVGNVYQVKISKVFETFAFGEVLN